MPTVDMNLCMKCFACVGACPNDAISDAPEGPKFDNKKCKKSYRSDGKLLNPKSIANDSKCGICAEMCPASA
ncbi:MAG: 4Fe-4S binding protein, partial [Nanoarchaeota archaeon]|nr:4Fe-4S binding protein [Nanoarchaeota archaeon]